MERDHYTAKGHRQFAYSREKLASEMLQAEKYLRVVQAWLPEADCWRAV
jgi:hypothetical protein